jgi:hypothetical protein
MNPEIFTWLVYALWLGVIVYLTIAAIGVKRDTSGSVGQRLGIMFGMIAAVGLPFLPVFHFLNYTPGPVVGSIGLIICVVGWAREASKKVVPLQLTTVPTFRDIPNV